MPMLTDVAWWTMREALDDARDALTRAVPTLEAECARLLDAFPEGATLNEVERANGALEYVRDALDGCAAALLVRPETETPKIAL